VSDKTNQFAVPRVGMRNLKTAFTVTLCALVYSIFERNPTFACIGAVFGMGRDLPDSIQHGGNRFFGTIIGGFLGMGLFRLYLCFYPQGEASLMLFPLLAIGIIILIVLSTLFWPGAVQPGGVVLCILLYNSPVDTFVSYAFNRMFDTGVGVAVALLVNFLLPRERLEGWIALLTGRFNKKYIKEDRSEMYPPCP